jgi:hypothetical protein
VLRTLVESALVGADNALAQPGTRVTVYLKSVPKEAGDVDLRLPFVLHALMQHEHKKTVLNFTVQRNTEYTEPVRSKVRRTTAIPKLLLLTLHGFRTRFSCVMVPSASA